MSKNVVDPERSQMTTWRMRFACCITKATFTYGHAHAYAQGHTHTYTRKTSCFPRQQWLRARASMLRCIYIVCLVIIKTFTFISHLSLVCYMFCLSNCKICGIYSGVSEVLWDVRQCLWKSNSRRFGGCCYIYLQGSAAHIPHPISLTILRGTMN
jgi:hypothetical protein